MQYTGRIDLHICAYTIVIGGVKYGLPFEAKKKS